MQSVCGVAAALQQEKIHGRGVRPRFSQVLPSKTKIFLGKKSSAAAPDTS